MYNYINAITNRLLPQKHKKSDARNLLALSTLFFLISLTYHILRCLKVTLVVKSSGSGAEILPFLKVWVILPTSFLVTWVYAKYAINKSAKSAISTIIYIFLGFFLTFICVLYPLKETLFLESLKALNETYGTSRLNGLINILVYWPYTLFYVSAELWSTLIISVLFWGFTNEISTTEQAKRNYALIAASANVAGIFSGQITANLTFNSPIELISFYSSNPWEQSIFILLSTVIVFTTAILLLFLKLCDKHANVSLNKKLQKKLEKNTNKASGSLISKWLQMPKYANMIAITVICYNIVHNLADVIWTSECTSRFADPSQLNRYLGNLDTYTGIVSCVIAIFIFTPTILRFGWRITSLIPPVVWAITSVALASTLYLESTGLNEVGYVFLNLPMVDLVMAAGTMQIFFGRAAKYTIFDQTKEIAYIPLPLNEKREYKAVIDGFVSRIGKSISSTLQLTLIIVFGSIQAAQPAAFIIIALVLAVWIYATNSLGHLYEHKANIAAKDTVDNSSEIEYDNSLQSAVNKPNLAAAQ